MDGIEEGEVLGVSVGCGVSGIMGTGGRKNIVVRVVG